MTELVVPGKASTVILARPGAGGGFEVLMTRRSSHLKVLAGFLVFPGGAVEEDDWSEKMLARCRGLSPSEAQRILAATMAPEQAMGRPSRRSDVFATGLVLWQRATGESLRLTGFRAA